MPGPSVHHHLPEVAQILSIESMRLSNHFILCHPLLLLPWIFPSSGQSIGASTSATVLPVKGWFPLGLTGLISLQAKGLSRVFSSITIWKHQFFGTQSSSQPNSHICIWLLEKPELWLHGLLSAMWCIYWHFKSCFPVDYLFLLCSFSFCGLMTSFVLCLCSPLFGFYESIVCFWFMAALFFKYVNSFLYLLALHS